MLASVVEQAGLRKPPKSGFLVTWLKLLIFDVKRITMAGKTSTASQEISRSMTKLAKWRVPSEDLDEPNLI